MRFRLGDNYWMYAPKEFKINNKICNDFVDYYVKLALQKSSVEKKAEEGHKKEHYVFLDALAEQTRDPVELRAQMLNILLAGRDTTSSLLSWLFHQLLRHPEVFAKLRQTILDTFGTYDNPHEISFATLKGCQYLQCCLNETLRLWSVVPGNGRRSNKATTLPTGGGPDGKSPVFIPPETQVEYSIHVMHRRKDLWGEDADEFKPERFQGRKSGWEFLPVRQQTHTFPSLDPREGYQCADFVCVFFTVQRRAPHLHRPAIRPHRRQLRDGAPASALRPNLGAPRGVRGPCDEQSHVDELSRQAGHAQAPRGSEIDRDPRTRAEWVYRMTFDDDCWNGRVYNGDTSSLDIWASRFHADPLS